MNANERKSLFKEIRETLSGELSDYDFEFGFGELTADFGDMFREIELSDGRSANVDFKAEGYRSIDRGDYYTPPSESGEITVYIKHVDVYNVEGEEIEQFDFPYPEYYEKKNTIAIKF